MTKGLTIADRSTKREDGSVCFALHEVSPCAYKCTKLRNRPLVSRCRGPGTHRSTELAREHTLPGFRLSEKVIRDG